jgi:hypothetical protein
VLRADTATTIAADLNPSVYGDEVVFTATVTPAPAAGTVQFTIDGIDLGLPVAVEPDGTAVSEPTAEMTAGDHVVEAVFSGSANYKPSASSMTQTVGKAASSTLLSVSPSTPAYGGPLTLTATVDGAPGSGTPSGVVQFSLDGNDTGAPVSRGWEGIDHGARTGGGEPHGARGLRRQRRPLRQRRRRQRDDRGERVLDGRPHGRGVRVR